MAKDAKTRSQLSRLESIPDKPPLQSLSPREMQQTVLTSSLHAFIVVLDHALNPATYSESTQRWSLSNTQGVCYKRYKGTDRISQVDLEPKGVALLPKMQEGYCERRTVYNTTQSTIPSCVPVVALQDGPGGDLYVVQEYTSISESSTTTTTTTSTTTTTPNPCTGKCKFVWDGTVWVEEENNCSTTTTTSTSTTSTTSKDPCICRDATTTTTTTTLDPSACHCQYPNFCANEVDECTYTSCSRTNSDPNVDCTTSTSTTSTTTPEPCDCGTTTTNPNDCGECTWAAYNGAVYRYSSCTGNCVCPSQPSLSDCSVAVLPCQPPVDPPPPDPPVVTCSGTCSWTWIGDSWWPESNNCESSPGCGCHPPTFDGDSFCGSVTTSCGVTVPDDDGGSTTTKPPCWQCYTSTTTSTTSTSTTEDPCSVGCVWMVEDGQWKLDTSYDACPFSCPCAEPGYAPTDDTCERAFTECGTGTTSTTTSTTTTSTTTCPPRWFCMGDLGSCTGAVCEEHSFCTPPADYCGGPYTTEDDCIGSSTFCSTTTSTTTTTTTTPECDQFKWFCVGGGCNSCIADLYCNPGDEPAGTCTGPHNSQAECLSNCSTTANPCAGISCTWQGTNLPPPNPGWTLIAPCGGLECTNCDTPAGVGGSATTTLMPCHP